MLGSSAAGNARADTAAAPTLQGELLATIGELFDRYVSKVPTPELNKALTDLSNKGSRRPRMANG